MFNKFDPNRDYTNNMRNPLPPHHIQPKQQPKTMCTTHSLVIDSRHRDTNVDVLSNNFQVTFNPSSTYSGASLLKNFKNILEIKLIECVIPYSFIGVTGHPYLILEIPELSDNLVGTGDALSRSFTLLLPDRIINHPDGSNGNFVHCRVNNMTYSFKKFNPPLNTLHKLTFKFNKPDGTLYTFTGVSEDAKEVMMVFEITTVEMDRNILNSNIIRPTQ